MISLVFSGFKFKIKQALKPIQSSWNCVPWRHWWALVAMTKLFVDHRSLSHTMGAAVSSSATTPGTPVWPRAPWSGLWHEPDVAGAQTWLITRTLLYSLDSQLDQATISSLPSWCAAMQHCNGQWGSCPGDLGLWRPVTPHCTLTN